MSLPIHVCTNSGQSTEIRLLISFFKWMMSIPQGSLKSPVGSAPGRLLALTTDQVFKMHQEKGGGHHKTLGLGQDPRLSPTHD